MINLKYLIMSVDLYSGTTDKNICTKINLKSILYCVMENIVVSMVNVEPAQPTTRLF